MDSSDKAQPQANSRSLEYWVLRDAVIPALRLLGDKMDSPEARVAIIAIMAQESALKHRYQIVHGDNMGKGPARGLAQFECGTKSSRGGVWGVYLHRATHEKLRLFCRERDVNFDPRAIWGQLEHDDILAAGVARLLLWTDSEALPEVGDKSGMWEYYLRNWRPGKPHPDRWDRSYASGIKALEQGAAL